MRFDVRKLAFLLLLATPAAQAQLWIRPAAVEVRPAAPAQAKPTPEPPRRETPAPVAPAPRPAPPAPSPAPPAPAPAPAAPPADVVRLRTAQDRTCFECKPGESALSTEKVIPPGGGTGCGSDIAARLKGGEMPSGLPEGCRVLRLVLPAGAHYTGYRYEIQDKGEGLDCAAGKDC